MVVDIEVEVVEVIDSCWVSFFWEDSMVHHDCYGNSVVVELEILDDCFCSSVVVVDVLFSVADEANHNPRHHCTLVQVCHVEVTFDECYEVKSFDFVCSANNFDLVVNNLERHSLVDHREYHDHHHDCLVFHDRVHVVGDHHGWVVG